MLLAMSNETQCIFCRKVFRSKRYLRCHLSYPRNWRCEAAYFGQKVGASQTKRSHKAMNCSFDESVSGNNGVEMCVTNESVGQSDDHDFSFDETRSCFGDDDDTGYVNFGEEDDASTGGTFQELHDDDNSDKSFTVEDELSPDTTIIDEFLKYVEYSRAHTCHLTPDEVAGIELLDILIKQRAPMRIFDDIFKWHMSNLQATSFTSKESLLKALEARYGMEKQRPKLIKKLILPYSKAEVDLVYHDFEVQVKCLLIDPRITDDDYLFFNNNPFSPPPANSSTISDINTGSAYQESYKKLITNPSKQVLLPIIMYIDAAVTGQYDHLPIEALKFTLGIFNASTRDKDYAWRSLGYVTKFLPEDTYAKRILVDSGVVDAKDYLSDDGSDCLYNVPDANEPPINIESSEEELSDDDDDDNVNLEPVKKVPTCSAQDLHAMLDALLSTYRQREKSGFKWKLRYKGNEHDVEFVPFIMFVKGDTQEHDKHCGKYTSRGQYIKNLCRYCCVPNEETDDPKASKYPRKTQAMVEELVQAKDIVALKEISQQCFDNCWYKVRFGQHNNYGIHGACPLEVLHWLQIGKFGYVRNMFFDQLGKTSELSKKINSLARALGKLFKRQSDRDVPRLNFTKGIKQGKLMAHEMGGVMVVLVACLRCYKGRRILLEETRGKSKLNFGNMNLINDWILLLETLLQWEAWMKEPEMSLFDIHRARMKIPEIMDMEKFVGKRTEGMQFRVFKFHASLHLSDDILSFGVPSHVNTQSDESHHKKSKTAAIHTQRRMKTFCEQTARNLHYMDIVDIGIQEIHGGRVPWDYYYENAEKDSNLTVEDNELDCGVEIINTGTKIRFFYSYDSDGYSYTVNSQMKDKWKFKLDDQLLAFIGKVFTQLDDDDPKRTLALFTEHKRNGQIFRASPFFQDKPWRDWVIIDWGTEGQLQAQIHLFVDLRNIPDNSPYVPSTYAIIESAKPNKTHQEKKLQSELFLPFLKEHNGIDSSGKITRKFHLVDTDAFLAPATVIPDIGNPNKAAYLWLRGRSEWKNGFIRWLRRPRENKQS